MLDLPTLQRVESLSSHNIPWFQGFSWCHFELDPKMAILYNLLRQSSKDSKTFQQIENQEDLDNPKQKFSFRKVYLYNEVFEFLASYFSRVYFSILYPKINWLIKYLYHIEVIWDCQLEPSHLNFDLNTLFFHTILKYAYKLQ